MQQTAKSPSKPSQDFVAVKSIKDGVVFLKNGGMCRILIVGGLNFDLKSDAEQNLILSGFQDFINTLDFSVQFFIHSRKVNIDAYLKQMSDLYEKEPNELLKIQIDEYINFIRSFVEQNDIVTKSFFTVVPYEPIFLSGKNNVFSFLQKKTSDSTTTPMQDNIEQLGHRVDQVTSGLGQMGLRAIPLEDEELIELFYNMYNPQLIEKKGVSPTQKF